VPRLAANDAALLAPLPRAPEAGLIRCTCPSRRVVVGGLGWGSRRSHDDGEKVVALLAALYAAHPEAVQRGLEASRNGPTSAGTAQ
jgi:hypothetical protein